MPQSGLSLDAGWDAQVLLDSLLLGTDDPMFVKDSEGVYRLANAAAAAALQLENPEDLIGRRDHELMPAAAADAIRSSDVRAAQSGLPLSLEEFHGSRKFHVRRIPLRDAQGRVRGLICVLRALPGRAADPAYGQDSEELLSLAVEAGRIGIFEWQVQSGRMRLSPKFLALYGLTEFDGRYDTWLKSIYREDRLRLTDLFDGAFEARDSQMQAEFRIAGDAAPRWMEARNVILYDNDGRASRVIGVSVDVTDRKRALAQLRAFTETLEERVKERTRELEAEYEARKKTEEALRQAQKMEAVGQLTGGVAHDFNNLLTVVLGGLDSIGRQIAALPASPATERIGRARERALLGVRRAVALTGRLLAFSRQQPLAPKPIDVNKLVAGISELLQRTLGEAIAMQTVLAGGVWRAFADSNQLDSALVNLAINARDAMPEGGKLTIETGNCYLDDAYVASLPEPVKGGQYVMLAVGDTGGGMDKATVERAFEPFFTTKPVGKGTGLGLSQVYGFVRQSGGHVKIYSEVGEGTTVKIYLPRHVGDDDAADLPDRQYRTNRAQGAEMILVVEDDDALRAYTTDSLLELGYRVLAASSAAAALEILDQGHHIDLLFTDVVMPGGMNGRQLSDEALRRRPGLKVLFTTGYTRNAIVHHGRLDPGIEMIGKPFSFDELAEKIRQILDR